MVLTNLSKLALTLVHTDVCTTISIQLQSKSCESEVRYVLPHGAASTVDERFQRLVAWRRMFSVV